MERFKDKVALVTGAASNPGLGRAIAQLLAHEGGKVVVWSDDITRFHGSISARGGAQGRVVQRAVERPDLACVQIWLVEKGDLCSACPRRQDCDY